MQNTVQKVVKRRGRNESTIRRTKSISGKIGNIDQFMEKKPQKTTCFGFFYNYFFYSCQNLNKSKAFWYYKKNTVATNFLMGKFNQNSTK